MVKGYSVRYSIHPSYANHLSDILNPKCTLYHLTIILAAIFCDINSCPAEYLERFLKNIFFK